MPRFGLKLGVGETPLVAAARRLWAERGYDFLELYVPLTASPADAAIWDWYDGLLVLHAPHAVGGFNFARPEMAESNRQALELMEALRERLRPEMVIFHSGLDGDIEEAYRQIDILRRDFPALHAIMLLENKPHLGLRGEHCLGSSPDDLRKILVRTGCGFCLDVRHAVAYAAWAGRDWREVLGEFAGLSPKLWHVADGRTADRVDSHYHIGDGDIDWSAVASWWRSDTFVTIECRKEVIKQLTDYLTDLQRLRG